MKEKKTDEKQPDQDFNENPPIIEASDLIKVPHRFNIMLLLYNYSEMTFPHLRKALKLTSGNLDYHLSKLIEEGWVAEKMDYKYRFIKIYEITEDGNHYFFQYAKQIRRILDLLD